MTDCKHLNFESHAAVNRIQESDYEPDKIKAYTVDLRIKCHDCGQPFEFFGFPVGMSFYQAAVSNRRA